MDLLSRISSRLIGRAGSSQAQKFDVKKVAIIGAGPCGLSAAKYLRAHGSFESIVIFEQQDEVGGVWNHSDIPPPSYPVPMENPFYPPDAPLRPQPNEPPIFPSAMYNRLHANIPGTLMKLSDQDFPKDAWAFPKRETIQQYLLGYAEDVRELIKFCYQVKSITLKPQGETDKWHLEARSTVDKPAINDSFDAVVLANGHYALPSIPSIKNIKEFHLAHPSVITHSKQYRSPDSFKDKKTVVVGNGPSGLDVALQINEVSTHQTLLSVRHATPPEKLAHTGCEEIAEIVEFLPEERSLRLKDGKVVTDIDAVVMCTGFFFSYPFLPEELQRKLITDGKGVHGLYRHLFCIDHPTLVFPGLNMKAVPWPLSEAQAAVYSAVWSNNLELPPPDEMKEWSKELEDKQGSALHVFPPLGDANYINGMHDWAMTASHVGKEPPRWDGELFWERRIYAEAKLLFEQGGCKAKTLEELGLHYDPDKDDTASG